MVLKAQYFPNCSFLKAKRGERASWAWSSPLVGRDILLRRSHWQIMNGKDVRVWNDRWLPSIPSRRPTPLGIVQVTRNLRVESLICLDTREWDIEFLKPFVSQWDFEAILGTSIGDPMLRDKLVWPFEKKRLIRSNRVTIGLLLGTNPKGIWLSSLAARWVTKWVGSQLLLSLIPMKQFHAFGTHHQKGS